MTDESLQDLAGHDLIIMLNVLITSDVRYAFVIDRHDTVMIALPDTPLARLKRHFDRRGSYLCDFLMVSHQTIWNTFCEPTRS